MDLVIIAAVADNGVIGLAGKMPWHLPDDLSDFRERTLGHPLIMGRNTFRSTGVLPGRDTIILTRDVNFRIRDPCCHTANTLEHAYDIAKRIAEPEGVTKAFVCGGAEIYRLAMPAITMMYISWLDVQTQGDTYFPAINPRYWCVKYEKRTSYGCVTKYIRQRSD